MCSILSLYRCLDRLDGQLALLTTKLAVWQSATCVGDGGAKWGNEEWRRMKEKDAGVYCASRVADSLVAERLHEKTRFWNWGREYSHGSNRL